MTAKRPPIRREHDADLCERIRELEKRIEELEAAPRVTYIPTPHYCYYGCIHWPQWTWTSGTTWTSPPNMTITYSADSSGTLTTNEVVS